tara:strand:- start:4378 stop:7524 length:3147 start_codon:yes stop_codon:yes gene_type:complete
MDKKPVTPPKLGRIDKARTTITEKYSKGIIISYNPLLNKNILLDGVIHIPSNNPKKSELLETKYNMIGLSKYSISEQDIQLALAEFTKKQGSYKTKIGGIDGVFIDQASVKKVVLPGDYFYISLESFTSNIIDQILKNQFLQIANTTEKKQIVKNILGNIKSKGNIDYLLSSNNKKGTETENKTKSVIKDIFDLSTKNSNINYKTNSESEIKRILEKSLTGIHDSIDDGYSLDDFVDGVMNINVNELIDFFVKIHKKKGNQQGSLSQNDYARAAIKESLRNGVDLLNSFFGDSIIYKYMENWSNFVNNSNNKDILNFIFTKGESQLYIKNVNISNKYSDLFISNISTEMKKKESNTIINTIEIYPKRTEDQKSRKLLPTERKVLLNLMKAKSKIGGSVKQKKGGGMLGLDEKTKNNMIATNAFLWGQLIHHYHSNSVGKVETDNKKVLDLCEGKDKLEQLLFNNLVSFIIRQENIFNHFPCIVLPNIYDKINNPNTIFNIKKPLITIYTRRSLMFISKIMGDYSRAYYKLRDESSIKSKSSQSIIKTRLASVILFRGILNRLFRTSTSSKGFLISKKLLTNENDEPTLKTAETLEQEYFTNIPGECKTSFSEIYIHKDMRYFENFNFLNPGKITFLATMNYKERKKNKLMKQLNPKTTNLILQGITPSDVSTIGGGMNSITIEKNYQFILLDPSTTINFSKNQVTYEKKQVENGWKPHNKFFTELLKIKKTKSLSKSNYKVPLVFNRLSPSFDLQKVNVRKTDKFIGRFGVFDDYKMKINNVNLELKESDIICGVLIPLEGGTISSLMFDFSGIDIKNPNLMRKIINMSNDEIIKLFIEIPLRSLLKKEQKITKKLYKGNEDIFNHLKRVNSKSPFNNISGVKIFDDTNNEKIKLDTKKSPMLIIKRNLQKDIILNENLFIDSISTRISTIKVNIIEKQKPEKQSTQKTTPIKGKSRGFGMGGGWSMGIGIPLSTSSSRKYIKPKLILLKMDKTIKYYNKPKANKNKKAIQNIRKIILESKNQEKRLLLQKNNRRTYKLNGKSRRYSE